MLYYAILYDMLYYNIISYYTPGASRMSTMKDNGSMLKATMKIQMKTKRGPPSPPKTEMRSSGSPKYPE